MNNKKVLFVLSSHDSLGSTGKKTGWWVAEAAHPWKALHDAGYIVDFVSPMGGKTPMTGQDEKDEINIEFLADSDVAAKINNTMKPKDVDYKEYEAIHFVGGHGAMWDFPNNKELQEITDSIWEDGKIVSAICHGVSGLLNVRLTTGEYMIKDRYLTSFTDKEEYEVGTCQVVPFLLQSELMLHGANYQISENWNVNVIQEGQLITGQNPQSGMMLGIELVKMLHKDYDDLRE